MLIYGYKLKQTHTEALKHVDCPFCGQKDFLSMHYFSKYAHVFWIPTFPYGKTGILHCTACGRQVEKENLTNDFNKIYNAYKEKAKHPKWMFSGTAIVVVLVVLFSITVQASNKREKEYLQAPKAGDLYGVKVGSDYTLMKVVSVGKDSIKIALNSMAINKMTKINDLDVAENYEDTANFSPKEIQEMYAQDKIYSVERK